MICPHCGKIDEATPTPDIIREPRLLGKCPSCKKDVFAIPTQKRRERSQFETVVKGEEREEVLARIYINHEGGFRDEKRPPSSDIDRNVYDKKDKLLYFLEIKERTNSLNAYRKTQFPYAKIDEAKKLIREHGIPVFIILKFIDCWARINVGLEKEYAKGKSPFAPRYRPWQNNMPRQVPVEIDVYDLEIMPWHDDCEKSLKHYLTS